jgi:prepilin-type N-terminal cleavage/methylation domain-containing protein
MVRLRGFTLIELLVVIAIIGILGTIGSSFLRSPRLKAEDIQALANMRQITSLIEQEAVASANGNYPLISGGDDDASWTALRDTFPSQAAQLPPVGQGYAAQSNATDYCLWKASKLTPANIIYCATGARCSDKEGVPLGDPSIPTACGH